MHLEAARTLAMRKKVHTNVIDAWAAFLNKIEELKSEASYSRMYFTCDTITDYMVDEAVDEELRYNKFIIMFVAVMNDITDKPDLKTVDLVFIPIVVDESYYLVCFCLKRVAFYIFDHIKRSGTIESAYGNIPRILKSFFCRYLNSVEHKKANVLLKKEVVVIKMKCQRNIVGVDCGIFLMRHMETYMGEAAHKWDCGLCIDNKIQEKMLGRLRYKYLDKLMMSDFNVMKKTFLKHYAAVKKMDRFERMKVIEEKKKEITGVLQ
ncbi:unnamed protein product [Lactuca virosa]|nr:unnamed protein product [Lactuca virosa]